MSDVTQNFDAALAAATINQESIQLDARDLSVEIDGTRYSARVGAWTTDGLKAAIADCLGRHCVAQAVVRTAAARGIGAA